MITLPPLACMVRTSRTQATPGLLIDRHRGQARMHVARHRVERIEGDDVAHLGAEFADLVDQADGAGHARQRDRDDAEKDGACAAGVAVVCAHRRNSPAAAEALANADYRRLVVHN